MNLAHALSLLLLLCPAAWADPATLSSDMSARLLRLAPFSPVRPRIDAPAPPPPADDAAIEEIVRYWKGPGHRAQEAERMAGYANGLAEPEWTKPSPVVQDRLFGAVENNPSLFPDLVLSLPDSPSAMDRLKLTLDKSRAHPPPRDFWSDDLAGYLMKNSRHLRDELVELAAAAHDDEEHAGWVEHEGELMALARLDWPRAEPLLIRFVQGKQPRLAAKALVLLYQHHAADDRRAQDYRRRLQVIATDAKAPGAARRHALAALLTCEWPGRDEWYLALFADRTLHRLNDGTFENHEPLASVVERDPDKWIPVLSKLVGNANRAVHDMAVGLVASHAGERHADALRALLPWLFDPTWSASPNRQDLIWSVGRLKTSEAIPGLIAVIEQGPGQDRGTSLEAAAWSLAQSCDPRALPALRRAGKLPLSWSVRAAIYQSRLACAGVSPSEVAIAIEAVARARRAARGRRELGYRVVELEGGPETKVSLGIFLSQQTDLHEKLAGPLLARRRVLEKTDPALAEELDEIIGQWPGKALVRDSVRQLRDGRASLASIEAILRKRETMREHAGDRLRQLTARGDRAAAVAAVALGDVQAMRHLLRGKDPEAKVMLLACARLVGQPLPLDLVGPLLEVKRIQAAAEAYLQVEDSEQARRLLEAKHAGEIHITGNRGSWATEEAEFDRLEDEIRRALRDGDGPDEVLALLSASDRHEIGQVLVRIKNGEARLIFRPDSLRWFERDLADAELADLRAFLTSNRIDGLGPLDRQVHHGREFELLRVTKAGGRRIFMNAPADEEGSVYDKLCQTFRGLLGKPGMTVHYEAARSIPGLEVLIADPVWSVSGVRKDLRGLMVEVIEDQPDWAQGLRYPDAGQLGLAGEGSWLKAKWIAWPGTAEVPAERLRAAGLLAAYPPLKLRMVEWQNRNGWAARSGGAGYMVGRLGDGYDDPTGLWRLVAGKEPQLVVEGDFSTPAFSSEGRWLLIARTDVRGKQPDYLVRLDLKTKHEQRIDIPEAIRVVPLLPVPGGVLVERATVSYAEDPTGAKSEHFIVEPDSGKVRKVEGDFTPLPWNARHRPQGAGSDRIWATTLQREPLKSVLGRYDLRSFSFEPVMELPMLSVDAGDVWVDEQEARVYLVVSGHLLRAPLPSK